MRVTRDTRRTRVDLVMRNLVCCLTLAGLAGCSGQRLVYDRYDVRIGIEADPSVRRANQPVANAHPAQLTTEQIKTLLGVLHITAWSGTIIGIFAPPQPIPLLTAAQLNDHAGYLSAAFAQAGPDERVFFSFPKPNVHYSEDRTTGALFFRERYLHVVVTDVSSVSRPDTGEDRLRVGYERDMKGMKLWIAKPATEATVPDAEAPRWAPFETVHISLNVNDVLARRTAPGSPQISRESSKIIPMAGQTNPSQQELQNQIRELTNSNLELRERLDEQKAQVKSLTEDMNRLRLELDQTKAAKQPSRKNPAQ